MKPVAMNAELDRYLLGLLPPRDGLLNRMEREAEAEGIPIIGPQEGMLLYLLIGLARAQRILELGTATGYSGLWMLRGTHSGTLTTFETNGKRAERARLNFAEAGFSKSASVLEMDATQGLGRLDGRFDACFIDLLNSFGSEDVTEDVFHACVDLLQPGGLLMADNALRGGEILSPGSQQARNVARYNELVSRSDRLKGLVIPIRDGLSVARLR